jgi:hypothetical protein
LPKLNGCQVGLPNYWSCSQSSRIKGNWKILIAYFVLNYRSFDYFFNLKFGHSYY